MTSDSNCEDPITAGPKRPKTRMLARVHPSISHAGYPFMVRIGCFDDQRTRWCRTREEADAIAETLNKPESRLAYFRKFFVSERECAAFLHIRLPKPKKEKPAESLTDKAKGNSRTYMATKPFRVKPYRDSSKPDLRFCVRGKEQGKYTRRFFATKGEADGYANARNLEVLNQGVQALEIPSWLRVMALECNQKLEARGKTLADATAHLLSYLDETKKSCSLSALIAEMLDAKARQGLSASYLSGLRSNSEKFAEITGAQTLLCDLTPQHVRAFLATLDKYEPQSKNDKLTEAAHALQFRDRQRPDAEEPGPRRCVLQGD